MQSVTVQRDAQALARANVQERVRHEQLPVPVKGMRRDKVPGDLARDEAVHVHNMHTVQGRLVVDTGYGPFGGTYLGVAQREYQAFYNDGTITTFLFTTTTVYVYVPTVLQWQLATWKTAHVTSAGYSAGAVDIVLAANTTDLSVGQVVGVMMDNGVQWITVIDAINVGTRTITLHAAIPAGRTVANGAAVNGAVTLHGDPSKKQVSAIIFPGNDWVIFCNGIDPVMYYAAGVVAVVPDLPTDTTCNSISVFHESVLIGGLKEGSTNYPHRARASDAGDPTKWTPGSGSSVAAIYDLLDTDDPILDMKILGPWLIAYRLNSIMRASYIGLLNNLILWEYTIGALSPGGLTEGVQSQGAVADLGNGQHFVVGHNNVYQYAGTYELRPVGDAIYDVFLSVTGDFFAPARATLFTLFVPELQECWIMYPAGTSTVPDNMLRVNIRSGAWFHRVFAATFNGASLYQPPAGMSWTASAGAPWSSPTDAIAWDSSAVIPNVMSVTLMPTVAGGPVQVYDYSTLTDNGTAVPWYLQFREVEAEDGQYTRWEYMFALATGNGVVAKRSQDEGATWTTVGTYDFGASPTARHIFLDKTSTRMMIELSGSDPDFQYRRGSVDGVAESEW